METLKQYRAAEKLERDLGDPYDPAQLFSFQRAVELDEQDGFPSEQKDELTRLGLHRYYIPKALGGAMDSLEEMYAVWRSVARRDVSVMVAHMISWFGVLPVWLAGTSAQKKRAIEVIESGVTIAYGLTERGHGADLRATEVEAKKVDGGYLVNGEKWLCNAIGKEGAGLILFAKMQVQNKTTWSLFFVEKAKLAPGTYEDMPRIKTLGIRAAPIAGLRFKDAFIADDALVGPPGSGLEIGVTGLMLTRIFMSSLSMGAMDSALRLVVEWALERRLYDMRVIDIPHAQTSLVHSFIDALICDCVSVTSTRAINSAPDQLALWHAVTKYFVPVTVEQTVRDLAVVLGARYFVREEFRHGVFQKILRDSMIVPLFDGSTTVVLSSLVSQLRMQLGRSGTAPATRSPERLVRLCALDAPVDDFDGARLGLATDSDIMIDGLRDGLARLEALPPDTANRDALLTLARLACADHEANVKRLKAAVAKRINHFSMSEEGFDVARRHCALHAFSATLNVWLHNRDKLGDFFAKGDWTVLALRRLLARFGHDDLPTVAIADVAAEMVRRYQENLSFTVVPLQLAERRG